MENKDLNKAERILNSLDGLQKAAAPDFFYTRLTGRMQNEQEVTRRSVFQLRPAFITTILVLLFAVNIISLTQLDKKPEQKAVIRTNKPATIESFAQAYNMETGSVYE